MIPPTTLWLIVGPSASGKSTLARGLTRNVFGLSEAISTTSRPARPGEVDGTHYHFATREEFRALAAMGAFVEWVEYNGNLYGVSRMELAWKLTQGDVLLVVEGEGAKQILRFYPQAQVLFLESPGVDELTRRMHARGDSLTAIEKRLSSIEHELSYRYLATYLLPPESPLRLLKLAVKLITSVRLQAA